MHLFLVRWILKSLKFFHRFPTVDYVSLSYYIEELLCNPAESVRVCQSIALAEIRRSRVQNQAYRNMFAIYCFCLSICLVKNLRMCRPTFQWCMHSNSSWLQLVVEFDISVCVYTCQCAGQDQGYSE